MTRRRRRRMLHGALVLSVGALVLAPRTAPATVEEQRARLPPPAQCQDPVEGVWMSHKYDPRFHDWYIFTVRIRRTPGDSFGLTGDIQSHSWDGDETAQEPPPCRPGMDHWTVFMTAEGRLRSNHIEFWGTQWTPQSAFCGHAPGAGEYNLDHFTGDIDPALQEFQSVNNDGGRSINDPTVFRRVRCFDPPAVPHVRVAPPPLRPPQHGSGCGRM